ncbi:hypothetical protein VP01_2359g1 [Puccinia sorghi]|uniref:Uncharacterized protein n=1 Tax=Puccinia sorghi TaxID=27349 RepID=A0A0L6V7D5_9BASI|nr:hypothetical protein VP01_2359g1 [Puccinia sorghi]
MIQFLGVSPTPKIGLMIQFLGVSNAAPYFLGWLCMPLSPTDSVVAPYQNTASGSCVSMKHSPQEGTMNYVYTLAGHTVFFLYLAHLVLNFGDLNSTPTHIDGSLIIVLDNLPRIKVNTAQKRFISLWNFHRKKRNRSRWQEYPQFSRDCLVDPKNSRREKGPEYGNGTTGSQNTLLKLRKRWGMKLQMITANTMTIAKGLKFQRQDWLRTVNTILSTCGSISLQHLRRTEMRRVSETSEIPTLTTLGAYEFGFQQTALPVPTKVGKSEQFHSLYKADVSYLMKAEITLCCLVYFYTSQTKLPLWPQLQKAQGMIKLQDQLTWYTSEEYRSDRWARSPGDNSWHLVSSAIINFCLGTLQEVFTMLKLKSMKTYTCSNNWGNYVHIYLN